MAKKVLAIDFDGVINERRGREWVPIKGAQDAVAQLIAEGYHVIIHTCLARTAAGKRLVRQWLDDYGIPYHDITVVKPDADLYLDDKAIRFTNWTEALQAITDVLASW